MYLTTQQLRDICRRNVVPHIPPPVSFSIKTALRPPSTAAAAARDPWIIPLRGSVDHTVGHATFLPNSYASPIALPGTPNRLHTLIDPHPSAPHSPTHPFTVPLRPPQRWPGAGGTSAASTALFVDSLCPPPAAAHWDPCRCLIG